MNAMTVTNPSTSIAVVKSVIPSLTASAAFDGAKIVLTIFIMWAVLSLLFGYLVGLWFKRKRERQQAVCPHPSAQTLGRILKVRDYEGGSAIFLTMHCHVCGAEWEEQWLQTDETPPAA